MSKSLFPNSSDQDVQDAIGYFDAVASGWTNQYRDSRHFQTRLNTVLEWMTQWPHELTLLDYGCGSGVLTRKLAQSGHALTGVDQSVKMLAEATKNMYGIPNRLMPRLIHTGSSDEAAYADRQYDGILCLGVLEYVEDPKALAEKLMEHLKPGGFLMVSVPNRLSCLRGVEQFIFRHPGLFRLFGLFPHLTHPDSYLKFQRHQFIAADLIQAFSEIGLKRRRMRHHVAPWGLHSLEGLPQIGMTTILEFIKK